jgi:hypothetical protein
MSAYIRFDGRLEPDVTDRPAASADYQLVVNPAYSGDRGPVSVVGVRLHGQF